MSRVRRTHGTVQFPCQKDNANYVGKAETLSTIVDYFWPPLKFTPLFRSVKVPPSRSPLRFRKSVGRSVWAK